MSREIRVLIIDDAVATRTFLAAALSADPCLSVVGSAANGRIGLAMIAKVNPDVVVLDLVMPEMDGLAVLTALRVTHPKLPVVVLSGTTRRGSPATLDAMALGADGYVTKPSSLDSPGSGSRMVEEELTPKIKALGGMSGAGAGVMATETATAATAFELEGSREWPARPTRRPEVIVIGVSTGGPEALATLMGAIPADFSVPILIVQHMPAAFTQRLAQRLDAGSALAISEAVDGQSVRPGQAVVAPGGWHMVARKVGDGVRVATHCGPPENSCRPSADVLFRSTAAAFGAGTLGLVMTGMGQDGLLGAEEICQAGGRVIAQDEKSSVVWGMPGFIVKAGLADRVLPLDQLAAELVRRSKGDPAHGRHSA